MNHSVRKNLSFVISIIIIYPCFVSFGQAPSSDFVYIGAPHFYSEIDAAGYSDWI